MLVSRARAPALRACQALAEALGSHERLAACATCAEPHPRQAPASTSRAGPDRGFSGTPRVQAHCFCSLASDVRSLPRRAPKKASPSWLPASHARAGYRCGASDAAPRPPWQCTCHAVGGRCGRSELRAAPLETPGCAAPPAPATAGLMATQAAVARAHTLPARAGASGDGRSGSRGVHAATAQP